MQPNLTGTTFFFDGSYDNVKQFKLQKTLAAIAAHSIEIDFEGNRFHMYYYGAPEFGDFVPSLYVY